MATDINIKFIDTNLFSGSLEKFRTAIGAGFYQKVFDSDGQEIIEFKTLSTDYNYTPSHREKYSPNEDDSLTQIDALWSRLTLDTGIPPINDALVVKSFSSPVRIRGNPTAIQSDQHWQSYLVGGTFADIRYPGVFENGIYQDYSFDYQAPYSLKQSKLITTEDLTNIIKISYRYKYYLPLYENHISSKSELLIPNGYMLATFSDSDSETIQFEFVADDYPTGVDNYVWDFVTLERTVDPNALLDTVYITDPTKMGSFEPYTDSTGVLIEDPASIPAPSQNLNAYLTSSLLTNNLSATTEDKILTSLQNIFFDEGANDRFIKKNPFPEGNKFPFHVDISFKTMGSPDGTVERSETMPVTETLRKHNFTRKFLKVIKEVFVDGVPTVPVSNHEFVINSTYTQGTEAGIDSDVNKSKNGSVRSCEFISTLLYAYNDYISETNNIYFIGDKNYENEVIKDTTGVYRYLNTDSCLGLMNKYFELLKDDISLHYPDIAGADAEDEAIGYAKFCSLAGRTKFRETIAYRIQKIGGSPSGESFSRSEIQNFFFINSEELDESRGGQGIKFTDTQVKYGQDYTYVVYAYVAVLGYKYQTDEIRISRSISSPIDTGAGIKYCLEFYNPLSLEVNDQLYQPPLTDELATRNEFATNAQITSNNRYLADFMFKLQPSMKIKEIPIFSKKVRVQDNPATNLDVSPFQVLDDSQKIGFFINYETQLKEVFPQIILSGDQEQKDSYLNSKDLLESEEIFEPPVSRIKRFQIFRTTERPTKFIDFSSKLHHTIDLTVENTDQTYSSEYFYDKINTNQKYYYLFRAVTEQNTIGHVSEIYTAELVDDGGFKYAIFNTLFEDELDEPIFINPSKSFKKMIHIEPNLSQVGLNTENLDFNKDSASQLGNLTIGDAESLIWGKRFKLRLSSKKTGKKIDLNITYNLNSE